MPGCQPFGAARLFGVYVDATRLFSEKKSGIGPTLNFFELYVCSGGPVQPGPINAGTFVLMIGKFSASAFFSIQSAYSSG